MLLKNAPDIAKKIKFIFLFILFPEVGFRKDVQKRKISRSKVLYSIGVNFFLPVVFLLAGLLIFKNEPLKQKLQQHTTSELPVWLDDYGRYLPIPFILLLDQVSFEARLPLPARILTLAATYIVGDFITYRTKKLTKEIRPLAAGGDYSFPSQHTDQAFIAAMNLHHQYIGARGGTIISLAGFACASTVGYLRFARNSHWSCDVLVGAAVGMISVNLIYAFVVRLITELIRIFWQKMMERIKSGRISKSNANL